MRYSIEALGPNFQADFTTAMQNCANALQGKAEDPEGMNYAVAAAGLAVDAVVAAEELDHQPGEAFRIWTDGLRERAGYTMPPVKNPENLIKGMLRIARASIDPGPNPPTTHAEALHELLHGDSVRIRTPYVSRYKE